MIIKNFTANNVHGYLNFDIDFNDDINFLVGLNGCGKTTALKLITNLLTPNVRELVKTPFESCQVEFYLPKEDRFSIISAKIYNKILHLHSTSYNEKFEANIDDILEDKIKDEMLLKKISKLANPVLVSLDRKFTKNNNDIYNLKNTGYIRHHELWIEQKEDNDPLVDVKRLLKEEFRIIERKKIIEDEKLKDKILLDAFNIIDNFDGKILDPNLTLQDVEAKRKVITEALTSLRLRDKNLKSVHSATDKYFYELTKNITELNRLEKDKDKLNNRRYIEALTFMFANQPQITRIDNLVKFIKTSQTTKAKLHEKINTFESIVNSFFDQTGKSVSVTMGSLKIKVNNGNKEKEIEVNSLSSGETQIITLFAHIIFNRRLLSKASFMIDEPELSLHLAWQEMFVESLKKANTELQVILATHSPAIIKGIDDKCVFVNREHQLEGSL